MKTKTSASKLSILLNDDGFDDIVFEDSDRQRRKGKKKTLSKSKILRDIKVQDGSSSSRRVDWRQCIRAIVDYLDVFILNQRARRLAAPFLLIGLLLTAVIEVIQSHFSYNIIIFSVLGAATKFPSFPKDSVRPQLCISLFTLFSFFVDINQLITKFHSKNYIITIMVLVMLSKAFVFNGFLRNASAAPRIRKYLDRRLRLFCFPLKQPKRIMRDIRGRFLALGWLHLFAVVAYVGFLLVFVFYFDYSLLLLSEQSGKMLPIYLLIKSFTTLCIFLGILYDTDVVLALWYFGCLGFSVSFVRQYIVRKRIELKGWPLAFAYYGLRFYALSFCKLIDVLWGFYGWYLISSNFMNGFLRVEDSLKIFLTFLMYTMVVTDIWCPILFFSIRWLLKRHKMMRELKVLEVSDDSEIEEFELRDELEPMIEADSRKQRKLEDFHRKYIEEGFEGEPGTMKLAVTRKPSKADKVKVKGNRKLKENMIMPEISHTDRDYDVDPEGQVALDSVSTIEPGHVLDHPDDNYRPKRRFEAQNPLIQPESLYPAVAPRHQDEDDDSFQEYDDSKYNLDVELQEIARKVKLIYFEKIFFAMTDDEFMIVD
jgi:hypothetical protein